MSNGDEVSSWARDGATLIVAITALVTALGLHCDQKQVSQQHTEEIKQNKEAIGTIEKKAEVAAEKADIAKDKAAVVENKVEKIEKERKTDK